LACRFSKISGGFPRPRPPPPHLEAEPELGGLPSGPRSFSLGNPRKGGKVWIIGKGGGVGNFRAIMVVKKKGEWGPPRHHFGPPENTRGVEFLFGPFLRDGSGGPNFNGRFSGGTTGGK